MTQASAASAQRRARLDSLWRVAKPALALAGGAYLLGAVFGLIPFTLQLGTPPGLDTVAYWRADLKPTIWPRSAAVLAAAVSPPRLREPS